MGMLLFNLSICVSGSVFGLTRGWNLALCIIAVSPFMVYSMHLITVFLQEGFENSIRAYGQSAGYAEQAINAIRVVVAFGQEKKEGKNYEHFLDQSQEASKKANISSSLSTGFFLFCIKSIYAYAFYLGCVFIYIGTINPTYNKKFNAGDVLSTFFGIIFGLFSLGIFTPNIKAIGEGKGAAKFVFEMVERQPEIILDDQRSQKVDIKGKIEFKNVNFFYPTRPDQKVLDNFSCVIQPG